MAFEGVLLSVDGVIQSHTDREEILKRFTQPESSVREELLEAAAACTAQRDDRNLTPETVKVHAFRFRFKIESDGESEIIVRTLLLSANHPSAAGYHEKHVAMSVANSMAASRN